MNFIKKIIQDNDYRLNDKNNNIKHLDNVKWILTLLIVLYHIGLPYQNKYESLFYLIKNLGDGAVHAFALISGFLFFKTVKKFEDLEHKIKTRFFSLVLPYLLWNFIHTCVLSVINLYKSNYAVIDFNIRNNILKWSSSPHFWYIFMLIFWTVFSPILFLLFRDKKLLILLLLSQIGYYFYKGKNILDSRFIYILYTWGGVIGFYYPDLINKLQDMKKTYKKVLYFLALLIFILISFILFKFDFDMQIKTLLYAIKGAASIILIFNLPLLIIGKKTDFKYSFWIFATHFWLDYYIAYYVSIYIDNIFFYQYITFVVVFTICLVSGIIVNKTIPKLYTLLVGNRS